MYNVRLISLAFDCQIFLEIINILFSFKNIRVTDWEKFGRHICKTRSTNIDFKKMIYDDDVWLTQFLNVTPLLFSVTQFEFQKVSASALEQIITEVAKNSFCQISSKLFRSFCHTTITKEKAI